MTNKEVSNDGAAYGKAERYIQRLKTGRFYHVLKSGCKVEKL